MGGGSRGFGGLLVLLVLRTSGDGPFLIGPFGDSFQFF